ncbi:MAG: hypothetical protein V3G42_16895, partial [Oscillospiraceae bacterium]
MTMTSTMSLSFVSCDDGDNDNDNSGVDNVSALTGIIDKESGLRLKSLGEYTVNYNNEGLYDSIAHNGYLDDY